MFVELPTAKVQLTKLNQYGERQWRITRCPFCGKKHTHGADRRGQHPADTLGARVAHCPTEPPRPEYKLVPDLNHEPTRRAMARGKVD